MANEHRAMVFVRSATVVVFVYILAASIHSPPNVIKLEINRKRSQLVHMAFAHYTLPILATSICAKFGHLVLGKTWAAVSYR